MGTAPGQALLNSGRGTVGLLWHVHAMREMHDCDWAVIKWVLVATTEEPAYNRLPRKGILASGGLLNKALSLNKRL